MQNINNLKHEIMKNRGVYLFLLPGFLFFITFVIYPFFYSLKISFYDWNILGKSTFIGLQNYIKAFQDPVLGISFRNTVLYTIVTVPGRTILGLGVALLLNRSIQGKSIFRACYFLPVVTSWVVVSIVFKYLFNDQAGLVNYILRDIFHIIPHYISWLTEPRTALGVIMILSIWKELGWSMIIFLAGLQGIPQQLYEAASIDGANGFQQLRRITLPLLRPTLAFVVTMSVIGSFQIFVQVYIVTQGGPLNQTHVVLSWMYRQSFRYLNFGYGTAISWFLFIIIFFVSFLQFKVFWRSY